MTLSPLRRGPGRAVALALLTVALVPGLAQLPADASSPATTHATGARTPLGSLADPVAGLADLDARGTAQPSAAVRRAVAGLGAVRVRWNQFGTPASILPADGVLAAAPGAPATAARSWLRRHAAAFGLTTAEVGALDLVNDQALADGGGHAVLFRQHFGDLSPALDSMVTVGVARGRIAYASSSVTPVATRGGSGTPPAATLTPLQGWLKAAADVGRAVPTASLPAITKTVRDGWTLLAVPGFAQQQQVRLRSLAFADGTVRPVLEANVLDSEKGAAFGYTLMVDAITGAVLHRQNQVENSSDAFPFTGEVTATACGPKHEFELTDDATRSIVATAAMANTADDIEVKIFDPSGQLLTTGDTATSPEVATYAADSIPKGIYSMQVCPYADPTAPFVPPGNYAASVVTSDQGTPGTDTVAFPPSWRYFTANPDLASLSPSKQPVNSVVGCWVQAAGCTVPTGALRNVAAAGPWDTLPAAGQSTLTSTGNNATTHEAWADPLAPGGTEQAPVSATREYTQDFTDVWNDSRCDPTNLVPGGNDIDQVVTNLFASHNRMHDFSYYLGFTEDNYNLQVDNLGRGGTGNDPEVGDAQAGALSGGNPSFEGRDNANQIALQDGVPGVTNQYLFQPIAGAFYSPCADGALDMSVVGHEYTHAISNRMIGGPDEGITSDQGGAMGESWSDLDAMEYMYEHHYSTGTSPYVIGAYATGNPTVGIRDYALDHNPLNYSDIGFDTTGVEVHADGEVWNGTQWQVRQALVHKWNKRFPYSDRRLQLRCAQAGTTSSPLPATRCPGNRRWIQLVFDSFLLQQGATSMLDARDAMLAADTMRFGGKDLKAMWAAFAKRGMGRDAHTPTADSGQPTPSFASPKADNAKVTFRGPGHGKVYVGRYEARVTPVADLARSTRLGDTVALVPGRYQLLYVSRTRGFQRFTVHVRPGQHLTRKLMGPKNLAAARSGAKILGSTDGSLNPGSLIDGTEATNWGAVTADDVDTAHPFVAVDLAGSKAHTIRRVQVSALLHPAPSSPTDVPLAADPDSGSRFTALRRFALEACVRSCASDHAVWRRFYTSPANAFPALVPRPVAPDLTLRSFAVPATKASAVRFVALENQCTGYAGYAGEQDSDPLNDTDCATGSDRGTIVHAAELQVFGRR